MSFNMNIEYEFGHSPETAPTLPKWLPQPEVMAASHSTVPSMVKFDP